MNASTNVAAGREWGASPEEWTHFSQVLRLGSDLLPVVSNPEAQIAASSGLTALGKVPSKYAGDRKVVGIPGWPTYRSSDADITKWSVERDYGIALQCRQARAIDVDIADSEVAEVVRVRLNELLGGLPCRSRINSSKFLMALKLPGEMGKRVIQTAGGAIEFLANGQQFIAVGTHTSGERYEWEGGLPQHIPEITSEQFERAWNCLKAEFEATVSPSAVRLPRKRGPDLDLPDPVASFLFERELVISEEPGGKLLIECPWGDKHTTGKAGDSSTAYFRAGTNGYKQGHFRCLHSHCEHQRDDDFLLALEYVAADFDDVVGPEQAAAQQLFYAFLPEHRYIHRPTGEFWPVPSVDRSLGFKIGRKNPSAWLDMHCPVHQVVWYPGQGEIIEGEILRDGARVDQPGSRAYNLYRPPVVGSGNPGRADRWREHLRRLYPDEAEASHIECWLAQRIQFPGVKINHALVLGGSQGIGKDTLLEPVKRAVGGWNWAEASPTEMLAPFNPWVKSIVLRVSETRDLGDSDRFSFYEKSKTLIAAPPDVLTCNEKNKPQHYVMNVMGVIYTTNNRTDGIYLPADDRRHFVVWAASTRESFDSGYFPGLWQWLENGGCADVAAYLRELDISSFDPKATPPKTDAFYAIVGANIDPRDAAMASLIEEMGFPSVLTRRDLLDRLTFRVGDDFSDLAATLRSQNSKRQIPHLMGRAGYTQVRNPDAKDGLWRVDGDRQVVYCKDALRSAESLFAARSRQSVRNVGDVSG